MRCSYQPIASASSVSEAQSRAKVRVSAGSSLRRLVVLVETHGPILAGRDGGRCADGARRSAVARCTVSAWTRRAPKSCSAASDRRSNGRSLRSRAKAPRRATPAGSRATQDSEGLYQDEFDAGRLTDLKDRLAAVERAEERLAAGTYGLSTRSGEPIPDERLEASPTAELTVEEAEPGAS